ncbi:hypothetical protein RFI_24407 [Reticulomyxa filosa]|uniref:Uncharacterized protein n=1 Tax=Reticulomyxa filosa TaxID=46433 RepID=X6MH48_RETFI|nr:hypothetical protein RFI_24407 [Reticulomyxa filosa]|eukprot:ETO12971.1 hypothetical protein RFI_24407 [Reticulomyxa filosa]
MINNESPTTQKKNETNDFVFLENLKGFNGKTCTESQTLKSKLSFRNTGFQNMVNSLMTPAQRKTFDQVIFFFCLLFDEWKGLNKDEISEEKVLDMLLQFRKLFAELVENTSQDNKQWKTLTSGFEVYVPSNYISLYRSIVQN